VQQQRPLVALLLQLLVLGQAGLLGVLLLLLWLWLAPQTQ
jgi:hypothetical protein